MKRNLTSDLWLMLVLLALTLVVWFDIKATKKLTQIIAEQTYILEKVRESEAAFINRLEDVIKKGDQKNEKK